MRQGVHFWHDSSAKNRIVSASSRSTGYRSWEHLTPAEPTGAPIAQRVAGQRDVERGRRQDPGGRAPGHDAPISSVAPPAKPSISSRQRIPLGAS